MLQREEEEEGASSISDGEREGESGEEAEGGEGEEGGEREEEDGMEVTTMTGTPKKRKRRNLNREELFGEATSSLFSSLSLPLSAEKREMMSFTLNSWESEEEEGEIGQREREKKCEERERDRGEGRNVHGNVTPKLLISGSKRKRNSIVDKSPLFLPILGNKTPVSRFGKEYCGSSDLLSFCLHSPLCSPNVAHPLQSPAGPSTTSSDLSASSHALPKEEISQKSEKIEFDVYGFRKDPMYENFFESEIPKNSNEIQWEKFRDDPETWKLWSQYRASELRDLAKSGIPDEHRNWAWVALVDHASPVSMSYVHSFPALLRGENQEAESQIRLDINRTFTTHKSYLDGS